MSETALADPPQNLIKQRFLDEILAMIKHLSADGKSIPKLAEKIIDSEGELISDFKLSGNEILLLHRQLSQKIMPAKPKTILLLFMESKKGKWHNFLGPVRLVRSLMATTLISLIVFIAVGLSPQVNAKGLSEGILQNSGLDLLLNLLFILSAAALGGCFSGLFQINKFLNNGTYDPKYESSYWIRLLLGLIAGLMLAVIIPVSTNIEFEEGKGMQLTIPLLAMLGGFSATLAYRILTRIVWAVESLFVGKQEDINDQKLLSMQTLHEQEKLISQNNFMQKLTKIKSEISAEKPQEEIEKFIDDMMNNLSNEN